VLTKVERAAESGGALYVGAAALVVAATVVPSLVMGAVIAGVTVQDEAGDGPLAWVLTLTVPTFAVIFVLFWLRARRRRFEQDVARGRSASLGLVRGALIGAVVSPPITAAVWLIGFTGCAALVAREPNPGTRYAIVERDGKSCVARIVERQAEAWRAKIVVDEIQTAARVDVPLSAKLLAVGDLRGKAVTTRTGRSGVIERFARQAFSPNDALVDGRAYVVESLCLM